VSDGRTRVDSRASGAAAPAAAAESPDSALSVDGFTGAASLAIPLHTSPARALQPDLHLAYATHAGNGPLGRGWSLPLPSIARSTAGVVPRYVDSDVFALDGQPLVPLAEDSSRTDAGGERYDVTRYAPRVAATADRIERWVRVRDGDTTWRRLDGAGAVHVFGATAAARIADPADPRRVLEWLLEAEYDALGEAIAYEHVADPGTDLSPRELGRDRTAQRYLAAVRYAPQAPVAPPEHHIGAVPETDWHVEVLLEWSGREDPFSRYDGGFEVRTRRLLREVRLFHRFEALGPAPELVHRTRLVYDERRAGSLLVRCDAVGCTRASQSEAFTFEPLPPISFHYTRAELEGARFEPLDESAGRRLPAPHEWPAMTVADLAGEGAPGVLYADGRTVRYWAPSADGHPLGAGAEPAAFPVERAAGGTAALRDATGDGVADLVVHGRRAGLYPGTRGGFGAFRPFDGTPSELHGAGTLADLDGDGLEDLVVLDRGKVRWYRGKRGGGFAAPEQRDAPPGFPASLDGGRRERVLFADVLGGGQGLVRISDGLVECWPSLGGGRFAERVTIGNAPAFGPGFDAARVMLADLDGSGAADLVYVLADRALVFVNESGNAFADPVSVRFPVTVGAPEEVTIDDLGGDGSPSIVVTSPGPPVRHWALALGGGRAHLLESFENGMGGETRVAYTTSARCSLEDAARGRPWCTRLPFAVPVVAGLTQTDHVTGWSTRTRFAYHHGLYAAEDRAVGFALVDRWDADSAASTAARHTRTWHAPGGAADPERDGRLAAERFHGDPEADPIEGGAPVWERAAPGDPRALLQARDALRGRPIREEIYGEDGGALAGNPYRVTETSYGVRVRAAHAGPHAPFLVGERESVEHVYERDPADPVVRHGLTLDRDDRGRAVRGCTVAYARRPDRAGSLPAQAETLAVCADTRFADVDATDALRTDAACERRRHELPGLPPPASGRYSADELREHVEAALASGSARTIEWVRSHYYAAGGSARARLGDTGPAALVHHTERAAFADADVRATLDPAVHGQALDRLLARGGYELDRESGHWWAPGEVTAYAPAAEFHRVATTTGPLGATARHRYDATSYAPVETVEAAPGLVERRTTTELQDYRALQPLRVRDPNENVHEVRLDALGRVVARTFHGTEGGRRAGFDPLDDRVGAPPSAAALIGEAARFLGGAAEVVHHALTAWSGRVLPGALAALGLEPGPTLDALASGGWTTPEGIVLDAFRALRDPAGLELPGALAGREADVHGAVAAAAARVAPHQVTVSAVDYPDRRPGPPRTAVEYVDGFGRSVERRLRLADDRWSVSGAVVHDARGLLHQQYEPYFDDGWELGALTHGAATVHSYDPLDRLVRVDTPAGFLSTTAFRAWSMVRSDEVDTVMDSPYRRAHGSGAGITAEELAALRQAEASANTPATTELDALGRPIAHVEELAGGERLVERYGRDADGRLVWAADARLVAAWRGREGAKSHSTVYSLLGQALASQSADAGPRWRVPDVEGRELLVRDGRGLVLATDYDAIGRPTSVTLTEPEDEARTVEAYVYGDQHGALERPADGNLVGELRRVFDESGMHEFEGYDLGGRPLGVVRRYAADPERPPDWKAAAATPDSAALEDRTWRSTQRHDARGLLVGATDAAGGSCRWRYGPAGLLESIEAAPSRGRTKPIVRSIEHDARGRRTRVVLGNGVVTKREYHPLADRVVRITARRGENGEPVQDLTYVYDPVGNVTHVGDAAFAPTFGADAGAPGSREFAYDALYRLVRSQGPELAGLERESERDPGLAPVAATRGTRIAPGTLETATRVHAYDAAGNLVETRRSGDSASWNAKTVLAKASNREAGRRFDGNGNLLALDGGAALEWNHADRLAAAVAGSSSALRRHDADGRLARELLSADGGDPLDRLLLGAAEIAAVHGVADPVESRTRVMDGERVVAETVVDGEGNSTTTYLVGDLADSVTLRLDGRGALRSYEAFTPYGATAFAVVTSDEEDRLKLERFQSKRRDRTTGLYDFGARVYAPWSGRWLSPDPAGHADGLNLYAFVGGNPASFVDVAGLVKLSLVGNAGLQIGGTAEVITPLDILEAVHSAAGKVQTWAEQQSLVKTGSFDMLSKSGVKEEMPAYAVGPGGFAVIQKKATAPKYKLGYGPYRATQHSDIEPGVHYSTVVGHTRGGGWKYDWLEDGANASQSAQYVKRLLKGKIGLAEPAPTDPNGFVAVVMGISETDRSILGQPLGMLALDLIKWGKRSFAHTFKADQPSYPLAATGGKAFATALNDYYASGTVAADPTAAYPKFREMLLEWVLTAHESRPAKTASKFGAAGDKQAFLKAIEDVVVRQNTRGGAALGSGTVKPTVFTWEQDHFKANPGTGAKPTSKRSTIGRGGRRGGQSKRWTVDASAGYKKRKRKTALKGGIGPITVPMKVKAKTIGQKRTKPDPGSFRKRSARIAAPK
jgi:insecticidal toxin complex protein TccC